MTDWILLLMFAFFGIIGYLVMGLVDRSINRHTDGNGNPGQEKRADEYAETGEPGNAYPGMPFFVNFKRKSHSRGF